MLFNDLLCLRYTDALIFAGNHKLLYPAVTQKTYSRLLIKIMTHRTGMQNCWLFFIYFFMRSESQLVSSGFGWRQVLGEACSRSVPYCPMLICHVTAVGPPWKTGCNHLSVSASWRAQRRRSEGERKGVGWSGGSLWPHKHIRLGGIIERGVLAGLH